MNEEKQELRYRQAGVAGSEWSVATTPDEFMQNGVYEIKVINDNGTLNFPYRFAGDDVAKLIVSDSGANGKQQTNRIVVQTITVTPGGTNKSITYTRTRRSVNGNQQWSSWVEPEAASTADIYDGSITAEKLSDDIRSNAVSPLRALFIAAGAEYNDTDIVQVKKVKFDLDWNETVEHLPHCYCLNGLGDISEDEMLKIYNVGCFYGGVYGALSGLSNRTNLGRLISANFSQDSPSVAYACQCTTISLCVPTISYESSFAVKSNNYFNSATKLRSIYGRLTMDNNYSSTFKDCVSLERVKIHTSVNVSLGNSPLISKHSLLYMINKATPTSAITITLHPDAYARLADDTDIVAALEAQPLISLVSA